MVCAPLTLYLFNYGLFMDLIFGHPVTSLWVAAAAALVAVQLLLCLPFLFRKASQWEARFERLCDEKQLPEKEDPEEGACTPKRLSSRRGGSPRGSTGLLSPASGRGSTQETKARRAEPLSETTARGAPIFKGPRYYPDTTPIQSRSCA